ncbi:acetylcholinesterase-1-like [Brevipalpus obovatus]|uniref:acetylcholinesterase-1-like n=1 Tax=Brevipalpus obovatus TaxID=246614 RepID=UPI003D9F2F3D
MKIVNILLLIFSILSTLIHYSLSIHPFHFYPVPHHNHNHPHHHRHHDGHHEGETDGESAGESDEPIVSIPWSKIRGFTRKVAGQDVAHFLGIPYAFPPVGPLRFRPTLPLIGRHRGVYNANSFRFACTQTAGDEKLHAGTESSENCLFINIYTPLDGVKQKKLQPEDGENLRPVLVFVHGSGYVYGSSANPHMYGGYLSSMGNMVFVIFNYRLGSLGFMYGGTEDMAGNAGLYDQKMAFQWIQDNIRSFGGDPKRVTVMGHSAGATFQTLHMFSNETRNLFTQSMIMSGTGCKNDVDSPIEALRRTRIVLDRVGCDRGSGNSAYTREEMIPLNREEVRCLRKVKASRLVEFQLGLDDTESDKACTFYSFLPVYGTQFLPKLSDQYLVEGNFRHNISVVMGKVPVESEQSYDQKDFAIISDGIDYVRKKMIATLGTTIPAQIDDLIRFYFDGVKQYDRFGIEQAIVQVINDLCAHCPTLKYTEEFARYNKVFLYYYTYITESYRNDGSRRFGARHADDTRLLFGLPFKDYDEYGDEDRQMSIELIGLWSKFVHEGVMPWPQVTFRNGLFIPNQMNITGHNSSVNLAADPDYTICQLLYDLDQPTFTSSSKYYR